MCGLEAGDSGLTLTERPATTGHGHGQKASPLIQNPDISAGSHQIITNNSVLQHDCGRKAPIVFFVLGCIFSLFPIYNAVQFAFDNKDYSHWHGIGLSVLAGEPLYADLRNGEPEYMYPPTAAVLLYGPLSRLSPVLFVAVLCLINAISWAVASWVATRIVVGKDRPHSFLWSIAPGLVVAPYIWDIQLLGQTNLLLLALTLGAFLAMRNRHSFLAGGLFGAAVALKAFPLPAIAYFIVRRQWTAVVASILSVFVLVWLLPGFARGFERNTTELKQWASLMIGDQSGNTIAGRSSIGFTRRNQSLVSVSHRLLRHVDAGDDAHEPLYINLADLSPRMAQFVGYGGCLLLGMVLLIACRFRFGVSPEHEGLEIAMVCTLVPLCSPLAWTYFFCWLLPAWTAIGFWLNNPRLSPKTLRMMKCGVVLGGFLTLSAVSEQIDPTLQAYGVTAFGSVTLFLTLALIRFNLPNQVLDDSERHAIGPAPVV